MFRRKNKMAQGARPMSRALRWYQKAAIVFMIVALLLLLAVLYLSVSQAVITITPEPRAVSTNLTVEVSANPRSTGQVSGYVIEEIFTKARSFTIPQEGGTPVEEKASGTVTLINETNAPQALVTNTRLLAEEGILFRLDESVVIPANGTLDTVVHADEVGRTGEIGASQFTIPGLSAASQEVVYAVSVESMTGGVSYITVLEERHLDEAGKTLEEEILKNAESVLKNRIDALLFDGEVFTTELITKKSDTEPGTEIGEFNVEASVKVVGTFYSTQLIADYAESELFSQVSTGFELVSVNAEGVQIEVDSVDAENETATLTVYLDGLAVVSTGAEILDIDNFVGKSGDEVVNLLRGSEVVRDASVAFTPFWLKRVPTLQDHVRVLVEPAQ